MEVCDRNDLPNDRRERAQIEKLLLECHGATYSTSNTSIKPNAKCTMCLLAEFTFAEILKVRSHVFHA